MKSEGGHKDFKILKVSAYAVQSVIVLSECRLVTFFWFHPQGRGLQFWIRLAHAVIWGCGTSLYLKGVRRYGRFKSAATIRFHRSWLNMRLSPVRLQKPFSYLLHITVCVAAVARSLSQHIKDPTQNQTKSSAATQPVI